MTLMKDNQNKRELPSEGENLISFRENSTVSEVSETLIR